MNNCFIFFLNVKLFLNANHIPLLSKMMLVLNKVKTIPFNASTVGVAVVAVDIKKILLSQQY